MNNISSVSFQGAKNQTQTKRQQAKKNILGGALAIGAGGIAKNITLKTLNPFLLNGLTKYSSGLTQDEVAIVNKGITRTFEELTNLAKKGVKLNDYQSIPKTAFQVFDDKKLEQLANLAQQCIDNKDKKAAKQHIREMFKLSFDFASTNALKDTIGISIAEGKNAFFVGKNSKLIQQAFKNIGIEQNSVNINLKKLPLAAFHEMGHAYNFNNSTLWKSIAKIRPISMIAPLIALIPAFTKDAKAQDGKELTAKEKRHNAIRKFAPLAAAATYIPTLMEEGKATLRGNKWAKEALKDTPNLIKKVVKSNAWGMASYTLGAIGVALMGFIAKKVKDASDEKISFKNNSYLTKENNYHQG